MRFPLNINNVIGRKQPAYASSGFKFPTTKEVEEIVADLSQDYAEDNKLIDRYFPTNSTFSTRIEMFMLRKAGNIDGGMTLVHQVGANVLPTETRGQSIDLAKASWSPLAFKESKTWGEDEMLYLGALTEEVQRSQIDEEVGDWLGWFYRRMENRRRWLVWEVLRTGKIIINPNDPYNPQKLKYEIDFGFTNMNIPLPIKFDAKDGAGKSTVDIIDWFVKWNKAATFKPEVKIVKLIVNSGFIDVVAENTHVQYRLDYNRGLTAIELRPPLDVYREQALAAFTRYTGIPVEIYDGMYEDDAGNLKYWIPNGEMVVICQNDSQVGTFLYTPYVAGTDANGRVQFGTGPYLQILDKTKLNGNEGTSASYTIAGGFHGLPRAEGYSTRDFSHNRIKWLQYANPATVLASMPVYPGRVIPGADAP